MKRDYYQILGVRPDASQAEIKRAYRKLAKRFHPDAARDDPRKKQIFQEIAEAYAVLSDPEARRQLSRLVQPFLLRRLKRDVLKELPPKIEHTRRVPLSEEERKTYLAAAGAAKAAFSGRGRISCKFWRR